MNKDDAREREALLVETENAAQRCEERGEYGLAIWLRTSVAKALAAPAPTPDTEDDDARCCFCGRLKRDPKRIRGMGLGEAMEATDTAHFCPDTCAKPDTITAEGLRAALTDELLRNRLFYSYERVNLIRNTIVAAAFPTGDSQDGPCEQCGGLGKVPRDDSAEAYDDPAQHVPCPACQATGEPRESEDESTFESRRADRGKVISRWIDSWAEDEQKPRESE